MCVTSPDLCGLWSSGPILGLAGWGWGSPTLLCSLTWLLCVLWLPGTEMGGCCLLFLDARPIPMKKEDRKKSLSFERTDLSAAGKPFVRVEYDTLLFNWPLCPYAVLWESDNVPFVVQRNIKREGHHLAIREGCRIITSSPAIGRTVRNFCSSRTPLPCKLCHALLLCNGVAALQNGLAGKQA